MLSVVATTPLSMSVKVTALPSASKVLTVVTPPTEIIPSSSTLFNTWLPVVSNRKAAGSLAKVLIVPSEKLTTRVKSSLTSVIMPILAVCPPISFRTSRWIIAFNVALQNPLAVLSIMGAPKSVRWSIPAYNLVLTNGTNASLSGLA